MCAWIYIFDHHIIWPYVKVASEIDFVYGERGHGSIIPYNLAAWFVLYMCRYS